MRTISRLTTVCAIGCAAYAANNLQSVRADAISINFASDVSESGTAVGNGLAGIHPVGHWNDVPLAQQTGLPLVDDSGVIVPGLTLSTAETYAFPSTAFDAFGAGFAELGNTALMRGHIYQGADGPDVDLTFTGSIPYENFDVIAYYNSGSIANQQTISILDGSGGDLGLSRQASESPGGDISFVESNPTGTNNANYVVFSQLDTSKVPADFVIRASGDDFKYFNGLQIVESGPPPPPPVIMKGHTWDVSADYSVEANPNPNNFGVWSYGRIDYGDDRDPSTSLDTFTLYDENGQMIDFVHAWQDLEAGNVDTLGAIAYNPPGDDPQDASGDPGELDAKFGITLDPLEVDFTPDQTNQVVSAVRFEAPIDGDYEVHAEYQDNQDCCAGRASDAWLITDSDGTLLFVDKLLDVNVAEQQDREGVEIFDGSVSLLRGQSVYFASGKGDLGGGDHVELRATVTLLTDVGLAGDFNSNGVIDAGDLDELATGMMNNDAAFDLDGDGDADIDDRLLLINDIAKTWAGDSNFDLEFNSSDLVGVFQAGKFETGTTATWAEGDWNGDKVFGTGDLVLAFQEGGFEEGVRVAVQAVPEPATRMLLYLAGLCPLLRRRQARR